MTASHPTHSVVFRQIKVQFPQNDELYYCETTGMGTKTKIYVATMGAIQCHFPPPEQGLNTYLLSVLSHQ